jgi:hypothetical protein
MVERKGNRKRYPLTRTRAWLGYLAQQMREHNQTVFYLEHLQPDWLEARHQRIYVWGAILLPAIVIGILMSILVQLFFSGGIFGGTDLPSLLRYGVLGGLLGGLWRGPGEDLGSGQGHRGVWRKRLVKRLTISVCIGLIYGLSFGLDPDPSLNSPLMDGLTSGIMIGFSSLLLQYLLTRPFYSGTPSGASATRLWGRVVRSWSAVQGPRALLVAVITGLSIGLSHGLGYGLESFLWLGLSYEWLDQWLTYMWLQYGVSYGLCYGLCYAWISLALRECQNGVV